jgi:hypothetical protein
MTWILLLLAVVVVLALSLRVPYHPSPRRKFAADAHELLTKAESLMLQRRDSEAAALFIQAAHAADLAEDQLQLAEANYGLARVARNIGDKEAAVRYLQFALSRKQRWAQYKPSFAALLERELQDLTS